MLKKAAKDDRGISMVMVVVILAFVALLLSMITYMSLYSYQMRTMDFSAQNTFYSAEMALNEIKAGVETKRPPYFRAKPRELQGSSMTFSII